MIPPRTSGPCTGPGCATWQFRHIRIVNMPQRMPSPRQWAWLLTATVAALLAVWMRGWGYDDLYITYRYAANIAQGVGFVYNPGEYVLSTTTPLYTLVLAFFRIAGADLPTVSLLMGAVSLALGGLALWHLGQCWGSPAAAWVGLLVYPFFPLLVTTLGSEQPFTLALVLWGTVAYAGRRYAAAALLLALAVLSRADSGIMALILAFHYLFLRWRREEGGFPWSGVAAGGTILLLWFGFAWVYFGSPLPATLAAKQAQGVMTISQSYWIGFGMQAKQYGGNPRYWLFLASAGVGILFLIRRRQWLPIVLWSGAHLAAYSLLGVTRYFWYYAQLVPGLIVLAGLGAEAAVVGMKRLTGRTAATRSSQVRDLAGPHETPGGSIRQPAGSRTRLEQVLTRPGFYPTILAALLVMVMAGIEMASVRTISQHPDARLGIYQEVGEWLFANTPADASVGTLEVGIIGYYAQRPMIDFAGLLQPDVVQVFRPDATYDDTAQWAIEHHRPDYLVLQVGVLPRVDGSPMIAAACTEVHTVTQDGYPAPIRILQCQWG